MSFVRSGQQSLVWMNKTFNFWNKIFNNLINTFNEFSPSAVADSINFQPGAFCLRARSFYEPWNENLIGVHCNQQASLSNHSCMQSPGGWCVANVIKSFQTRPMPRRNSHKRIWQHERQSSIRSATFRNKVQECLSDSAIDFNSHRKNAVFDSKRFEGSLKLATR